MTFKVGDSVRVSNEPYLDSPGVGFVYPGFAGQVGTVVSFDEDDFPRVLVEGLEDYPDGLRQWVNPDCLTLVEE